VYFGNQINTFSRPFKTIYIIWVGPTLYRWKGPFQNRLITLREKSSFAWEEVSVTKEEEPAEIREDLARRSSFSEGRRKQGTKKKSQPIPYNAGIEI